MIAGIVQARLGSTRFPGKVLHEVAGEPLLWHQIRRLRDCRTLDALAVATTTSPSDDAIAAFCEKREVRAYRGSEADVLSRYVEASRMLEADVIVRLTADCPLIDPDVVDRVVTAFVSAEPKVDFASNSLPPYTFPEGMDTEVVSRIALERAAAESTDAAEREHVTFYIWMHPERFEILRLDAGTDLSRVRLTVDYPADLEVVGPILEEERRSGRMSMRRMVEFLDRIPIGDVGRRDLRNAGWPEFAQQAARDGASRGVGRGEIHHEV